MILQYFLNVHMYFGLELTITQIRTDYSKPYVIIKFSDKYTYFACIYQ